MNKEQLEKEHAHVKEVLAEENDFVNSKEFYELPEMLRNLHTIKKSALETYIKALSIELWGVDNTKVDITSLLFAGLLGAAFSPTSFNNSIPPMPPSPTEEKTQE